MQYVDLDQIMPNPWQTRAHHTPEHVTEIADSVRARLDSSPDDPHLGLLQIPHARPHPQGAGLYQLVFGHTRLEAFKALLDGNDQRFARMPLEIAPYSDREMSDLAAIENAARADLSPLEKAHAIQRRMEDFHLSQLEAGTPFGYRSQGAVSNLLRLLVLPAEVLAKVDSGELAERQARKLVELARLNPKKAGEAAGIALSATPDGRDAALDRALEDALAKSGRSLDSSGYGNQAFPLDWPKKPISAEIAEGISLAEGTKWGELAEWKTFKAAKTIDQLLACDGCPFRQKLSTHREFCTRPACFDIKRRLWQWQELQRVHQDTRILILSQAEVEGYRIAYTGNWQDQGRDIIAQAIKDRDPALRLIVCDTKDYYGTNREGTVGSKVVGVALPAEDLEKRLKVVRAAEERRDRDRERSDQAQHQHYQQALQLLGRGAALLAAGLPAHEGLLELLARQQSTYLEDTCWFEWPYEWCYAMIPPKGDSQTAQPKRECLIHGLGDFVELESDEQRTLLMFIFLFRMVKRDADPGVARGVVFDWAKKLGVKIAPDWHKDKKDGQVPAKRGRPAKGQGKTVKTAKK